MEFNGRRLSYMDKEPRDGHAHQGEEDGEADHTEVEGIVRRPRLAVYHLVVAMGNDSSLVDEDVREEAFVPSTDEVMMEAVEHAVH